MNRFVPYLWLLAVIFFVSCQHETLKEQREPSDSVAYSVSTMKDGSFIKTIRVTGVTSRQQIHAELELHNPSSSMVSVESFTWEIHTNDGMRSAAISAQPLLLKLQPGASGKMTMIFEPIHSRQQYQETGARGDIRSAYVLKGSISLPGKENANESLQLTAKHDDYERSLKTFGLKATSRSYILSFDDEFIAGERVHLRGAVCQENMRRDPDLHLSSQEMLINGLWMKIEANHRRDTLHIVIRLVNQSLSDVNVDVPQIHVIHKDSVIPPLFRGTADPVIVPNGRRAEIRLKFPVRQMETFRLALKAAFISPAQSCPVFFSPLSFREPSSHSE